MGSFPEGKQVSLKSSARELSWLPRPEGECIILSSEEQ